MGVYLLVGSSNFSENFKEFLLILWADPYTSIFNRKLNSCKLRGTSVWCLGFTVNQMILLRCSYFRHFNPNRSIGGSKLMSIWQEIHKDLTNSFKVEQKYWSLQLLIDLNDLILLPLVHLNLDVFKALLHQLQYIAWLIFYLKLSWSDLEIVKLVIYQKEQHIWRCSYYLNKMDDLGVCFGQFTFKQWKNINYCVEGCPHIVRSWGRH